MGALSGSSGHGGPEDCRDPCPVFVMDAARVGKANRGLQNGVQEASAFMKLDKKHLSQASSFLARSKSICILTGAGISAESGIKTFRDAGGLWENHPIEKVATLEGFVEDPR